QLNHNFASLFSYFQKVDRQNERMAQSFEYTYEKIQDVSNAQINSLKEFDDSVAELKAFTTSILDAQADVRKSFEHILQKTGRLVDTMGAHNKTLKEIFGANLTERLSDISVYLADLNDGFDRVGDAIGTLPEALEVINQTQREHQHLLGDRFRELREFNQTFNAHLKNHGTETAKLEKQMRDAAATFELMATKNSGLLNEMNRMITEANQTFTNRDQ